MAKRFPTHRSESSKTRRFRWYMNIFPAFRRTGARASFISGDWQEAHLRLPLNLWTRNYVGTIFGGSMFAALDPVFMLMYIKALGPDYVVLVKSGTIRFRKLGRGTLRARFLISDEELEDLRQRLAQEGSLDLTKTVEWLDEEDDVVSRMEETLYFATKEAHAARKQGAR